jgi:hypothetical protein
MKKILLMGAAASLLLGATSDAQTIINITGATAFRSAAIQSINAAFGAGLQATSFANTTSSGSGAAFGNSSMQIWKGNFPGITGETIIRTSWNGSVEGIRAVAQPGQTFGGNLTDPLYLKTSVLPVNGNSPGVPFHSGYAGANPANYEDATSDLAFSDVAITATPVPGSLGGGPVGVVVFTMIANKTWAEDKKVPGAYSDRMPSNITAQQFRSMAANGFVPMSFFTGDTNDTTRVFLTGRNDGSGTRTSYLSETGVGPATPIKQYVGHERTNATVLPSIALVPPGGGFSHLGVPTPANQSTVWGNNLDGNGGYVSSSDVRADLSKHTTNTVVYNYVDFDDSFTIEFEERDEAYPADKLYMISWITYDDARSARGTGSVANRNAEILAYDGVRLEQLAGENPPELIGDLDKAKVANGTYTAWNFQQLYYETSRANNAVVFNELRTRLDDQAVIGKAGIPMNVMNVARVVDGGVVLPK